MLQLLIKINKFFSRPLKSLECDFEKIFFRKLILKIKKSRIITEAGGSNRPMLKIDKQYTYIGVDLDNSFDYTSFYDKFYCKNVEDILEEKSDLIFSKYLMEHIKNVEKSYVSQIQSLNPGGTIIHLYPLGYHPFSLLNKMLGNNLVKKIISINI